MTNHYHLVVETELEHLSAGMQRLNGVYAQAFNRRNKRWGHLFGERFASWVVEDENHLARTIEYVLHNPVRAGLVDRPEDWPWSASRNGKANACSRPPTRLDWRGYGPGRAGRPRRERAQPQGHHRPAAPPCADLRDRPLRLGQVEPRLRHDLRRGPAPLRREPLRLRTPVPADDGEAGRRFHRRPQPGHLDRPEDHQPQPALDGRHGHRDLRLPAPALRAHRPPALPGLRPPDRRPEPGGDRRPDPAAPGGNEVHGQRAGRPRPQGRVQGRLRGAPCRGVHAREGGRRAAPARAAADARQEVQAHDRGRGRPPRHEARPPPAPGAVGRDRLLARGGPGDHRRRRRRGNHLLRELRLP